MTPSQAIAMLDRQLARHGEDVSLNGGTKRAFVRGYKPDELVGDVRQTDRLVVLSPTDLGAQPVRGGKVVIAGKTHNIEAAGLTLLANTLVRIDLRVRG